MKISVLMDNLATPPFVCEHGLSLLIETDGKKILFDMGKSDLFAKNADMLGLDLAEVNLAVISHGHYDHGGGLADFMERNSKAPIYVHEEAYGKHFAARQTGEYSFIGISSKTKNSDRIILVTEDYKIDENLYLFSSVNRDLLLSKSNDALLVECLGCYQKDSFSHEQNLLIRENGKWVLVAGCAHCGIVNIVNRAMEIAKGPLDVVVGGFHLSNPSTCQSESIKLIDDIAKCLLTYPTSYYTCHCTGMESYQILKSRMGNNIHYIAAGTEMVV